MKLIFQPPDVQRKYLLLFTKIIIVNSCIECALIGIENSGTLKYLRGIKGLKGQVIS